MDKIYLRECIECKQFLPLGEFYASIDKKTGREARYSRCKNALQREEWMWLQEKRESIWTLKK